MKTACCILGTLLLAFAIPSIAETTATIAGIATQEGAPLSGVDVTISSPAMQGQRSALTDVNGRYAFVAVPPGEYNVSFEREGMQPSSTKISVGVGQTGRADVLMHPRQTEGTGAAEAGAAAVETKAVQTNLSGSTVDLLPMQRDIASTVALATGSVASAQPQKSAWLLDGGVDQDPANGAQNVVYVDDAIQETTVLSGSIPAEYGRFIGGVVNSITRSGGNEWSGSFRDSVSNPSWTAPSPYQNIENADETSQVFEATAGGRILRDQLWFFLAGRQFSSTLQDYYVRSPSWGFTSTKEDRRWQAKLTGHAAERHSLVASYLEKPLTEDNRCWRKGGCIEPSGLSGRSNLSRLATVRYTGMLSDRFSAEAFWTGYSMDWDMGEGATDRAGGTWGWDVRTSGTFGAPVFGPKGEDTRETENYAVKTTWYAAAPSLGSHKISAGYDHFVSDVVANNYQSGSDFGIYTFSKQTFDLHPGDVFKPTIAPGDFIQWMPILEPDVPSAKKTNAMYVNDGWDFGPRWSFNLGLRYDLNDIVDEAGTMVSDTGTFQPRLAATWDAKGDGRYRINASYARYADRILDGVASSAFPGGQPLSLYWEYTGPVITGLPTVDAFRQVFEWFDAQCDSEGNCGTGNMDAIVGGAGGAVSTRFGNSLHPTTVDELSLGFSIAAGADAFLRVDAMTRDWSNFLVTRVTQETGQTADLFGNAADWKVIENNDAGRKRQYDAVIVQGSYRFGPRWNLGGNYTWSSTTVIEGQAPDFYPELTNFVQGHPTLDERVHNLRAWLMYDLPTKIGTFDFSVLESFDSGGYYAVAGDISTAFDPVARNSYASPPNWATYWFTPPGSLRWDDVTSTDLGIRYHLPVRWSGAFFDFSVTNAFNESAQTGGDAYVSTRFDPSCRQTANPSLRCALFNPFTETPVEGVHYVKSKTFGQATSTSHYQTPRTYSFSAGIRF